MSDFGAQVRDESTVVDGHRLHYLRAGEDGPPLVLLHGGIIDAAHLSWGAAVEPLASDFRVYALDMLGYGGSAKPDASYATTMHVDVVRGFLDAVGLDSARLAGVSLGGGVALGLALDHPDRVDRLAVVDGYGLGRDLPNGLLTYVLAQVPAVNRLSVALLRRSRGLTRASLTGLVHDDDVLTDDLVDAVYEELQRPGVGRAFRRWRQAEVTRDGYRTVYTDRLDDLAVPTLVAHGAHDDLFPLAWAERAAERIPDAELHTFEDCAHWPPRERPDECNDAVASFLA